MGNFCCCCTRPQEVQQPVLKRQQSYSIDDEFPFVVSQATLVVGRQYS